MNKPIKWKIVGLGFVILAIGIIITIFTNNWNEDVVEVNPVGLVITFSSIFVIGWGLRIRTPEG